MAYNFKALYFPGPEFYMPVPKPLPQIAVSFILVLKNLPRSL